MLAPHFMDYSDQRSLSIIYNYWFSSDGKSALQNSYGTVLILHLVSRIGFFRLMSRYYPVHRPQTISYQICVRLSRIIC